MNTYRGSRYVRTDGQTNIQENRRLKNPHLATRCEQWLLGGYFFKSLLHVILNKNVLLICYVYIYSIDTSAEKIITASTAAA